jgi:hypothetical protein
VAVDPQPDAAALAAAEAAHHQARRGRAVDEDAHFGGADVGRAMIVEDVLG